MVKFFDFRGGEINFFLLDLSYIYYIYRTVKRFVSKTGYEMSIYKRDEKVDINEIKRLR